VRGVRTRPLLLIALVLAASCGEEGRHPMAAPARSRPLRSSAEPLRIDMAALHAAGGVPPGWRFTLPDGDVDEGRRTFVELGCHSCHAVKGESFAPPDDDERVGPELTGMGSHHPPLYFAESIVNPDAVIIEGYADHQGRSRMPGYPDLTVVQLVDLVAYLQSLISDAGVMPVAGGKALPARPAPPATGAGVFYVQSYDVKPGELPALEAWFAAELLPALRAIDGFVGVESWVDNGRQGAPLVTQLAFRDDAALMRFLADPAGQSLKVKFDSFLGPHAHQYFRKQPIYRVDSLSAR
jgi:mono/diheme cytochrome c family protein